MTTTELYKAIGVADYESLECWRKDAVFHLRLAAFAFCYQCPQCGNPDASSRGQADRIVQTTDEPPILTSPQVY